MWEGTILHYLNQLTWLRSIRQGVLKCWICRAMTLAVPLRASWCRCWMRLALGYKKCKFSSLSPPTPAFYVQCMLFNKRDSVFWVRWPVNYTIIQLWWFLIVFMYNVCSYLDNNNFNETLDMDMIKWDSTSLSLISLINNSIADVRYSEGFYLKYLGSPLFRVGWASVK